MATTGALETTTAATFHADVIQSEQPVLVDFSAGWCPPCQMLAPVLESLATELAGRVRVVYVDVDSQPELAARFGIQSIPALHLYRGGQQVGTRRGFQSREQLIEWIDSSA